MKDIEQSKEWTLLGILVFVMLLVNSGQTHQHSQPAQAAQGIRAAQFKAALEQKPQSAPAQPTAEFSSPNPASVENRQFTGTERPVEMVPWRGSYAGGTMPPLSMNPPEQAPMPRPEAVAVVASMPVVETRTMPTPEPMMMPVPKPENMVRLTRPEKTVSAADMTSPDTHVSRQTETDIKTENAVNQRRLEHLTRFENPASDATVAQTSVSGHAPIHVNELRTYPMQKEPAESWLHTNHLSHPVLMPVNRLFTPLQGGQHFQPPQNNFRTYSQTNTDGAYQHPKANNPYQPVHASTLPHPVKQK